VPSPTDRASAADGLDGALLGARRAPVSVLTETTDQLLEYDAEHVWHPYAPSGSTARLVESAQGVRIRLAGVGEVIDGMSSWWAAIHGYRHPALDAALVQQASRISHVMFGGLTHAPAVELTRRLLALARGTRGTGGTDPAGPELARVFLCDSGSVSVEVAVKLCLQYQRGRGAPGRNRLLTVRGGYHGDTFTAMSLCDPVNGMHSMFTGVLPRQIFAPRPPDGFTRPDDDPRILEWAVEVGRLAEEHGDELAGVIVEPVLQGAGGMHVYSPACLRVLRAVADVHGVPLVLDEIATGFGRTGTMFAHAHAGVLPDVMCVGKALTGGYLSLAAVLCSAEIAAGVDASESGALMHGPTFMGNPLACAVAAANLDLLADGHWPGQLATLETGLRSGLAELVAAPGVRDVRVLGGVGVVQTEGPVDVAAITAVALAHGVWLRPFRDLIYTMPPYTCTVDEVATIATAIRAAVYEVIR
jgi:adenosylmethionine-8-amino-7-oxononanoate aminotransferase